MAQLAKHLKHKDKDLNLNPSHPCKSLVMVVCSYTRWPSSPEWQSFNYEVQSPEPWIKTNLCLYKLVVVSISVHHAKLMLITNRLELSLWHIMGTSFLCLFTTPMSCLLSCLFFFVLFSCKGSLSILDMSPSSDDTWQIFSPRPWLGFSFSNSGFLQSSFGVNKPYCGS